MTALEPEHGRAPARSAPRPALRLGRHYFYLALRTGLWTAAALSCAAYLSFEKLSAPAPLAAPEAPREPAGPEAPLAAPPPEAPAPPAAAQDSVALVKSYRPARGGAAPKRAARPRLVTPEGSKNGWFAQNVFPAGSDGGGEAAAAPRPDPDAPAISGRALKAGLRVKGARPVPKAVARRYAADPEGESARQGRLIRETAEAAERERLARKRLLLYTSLFFLVAAFATAASRVIQAWRGIHKPDGPHWTLR